MNLIQSNIKTMSSREIADLTGKRHDNVCQLIRKLEIDQLLTPEFQEIEQKGRFLPVYKLNKRDSLFLVARLSPEFTAAIVDRWQELEEQAAKPMTQLEVMAGLASAMVDQERKQLEQAETLAKVESKLVEVEAKAESQIWDECPVNALSISSIRQRINDKYSIPSWAVDEIVRGGYGPRPAGQVRNSHENANGRTYTVWWVSDITKHFERIAKESEAVTATLCTHPDVSKRFKLVEA